MHYKHAFNHGGWRRHVHDWLRSLDLLLCLVRRPARGGLAFLGIGCYWLGDVFCLWATLHGFSAHTPPIAALLVGYATGYALTRGQVAPDLSRVDVRRLARERARLRLSA